MGQGEAVLIRPAAGGPRLKKNAQLSFRQGVLEITDPRRRTHTVDLSDGNGPYEFRYGSWQGEADFALTDGSGHAVLLVDQKSFHIGDMTRLQQATGLSSQEVGSRPPTTRNTVALINLPYVTLAYTVFAAGALAFGLWSVTHIDFFVFGVTLPAVIILIPLLIVGRRSMLSAEDFKREWANAQPEIDEALALADEHLAEQPKERTSDPDTPPVQASPPASLPPESPDAR